ncbi:MAG TPA: rRNA maturation RNase YbeY [Acidimicrobiia bacterium]|nr:rRNA maturation RNase YbeY [Acidimicrobiia bacterium]
MHETAVFGANEQRDIEIDVARWLRLARLVLTEERVLGEVELSVLFVDETTIADLNARYLGGDGPTDVLAFPIDDDLPPGRQPDQGGRGPGAPAGESDEPPTLLGDVVVCPVVAQRQALERGVALDDEVALLVVHGVLHLLDYDHAEAEERLVMERRQGELLTRFRELEERS